MTIICCREGWLGLESVLQLLGWPLHCGPPLLLADCSYSGHWADLCLQVLGCPLLCCVGIWPLQHNRRHNTDLQCLAACPGYSPAYSSPGNRWPPACPAYCVQTGEGSSPCG